MLGFLSDLGETIARPFEELAHGAGDLIQGKDPIGDWKNALEHTVTGPF
jgi:hypothetical protein